MRWGPRTCARCCRRVPKVRVWLTKIIVLVAMMTLCRTRIRYTCLLFHLVGDDLAGGIEEGGIRLILTSMEWWISSSLCVI
jgi:hypothetical protein